MHFLCQNNFTIIAPLPSPSLQLIFRIVRLLFLARLFLYLAFCALCGKLSALQVISFHFPSYREFLKFHLPFGNHLKVPRPPSKNKEQKIILRLMTVICICKWNVRQTWRGLFIFIANSRRERETLSFPRVCNYSPNIQMLARIMALNKASKRRRPWALSVICVYYYYYYYLLQINFNKFNWFISKGDKLERNKKCSVFFKEP